MCSQWSNWQLFNIGFGNGLVLLAITGTTFDQDLRRLVSARTILYQILITFQEVFNCKGIDLSHKSHNAPDKYPTMHHFVTEMCTHVHISVTKWCIMGYLSDASWHFWDGYTNIIWVIHQKITCHHTKSEHFTTYFPNEWIVTVYVHQLTRSTWTQFSGSKVAHRES